jgi:hypothetical protein
MILEVLEAQEPAVFRQQLFNTLTTYYEIQLMSGAGGRPKPKHCDFKRTKIADEGAAGSGKPLASGEPAAATDDDAPPPAADDAAPANPATTPAKKAPKTRGGSGGAKE